jgi:hypothetical protein
VFTQCHRCDGVYRFLSAAGNDRDYDSPGSITHADENPTQDDRWRDTEVIGRSRHRRRKTFSKSPECRQSKRVLSAWRGVEKNANTTAMAYHCEA